MTISILVDMNLSPDWVPLLGKHGWISVHWSQVGDPWASDRDLMDWALARGHIVFTHDLDFGTVLALTHARGPSVFQVRAGGMVPEQLETLVVVALKKHESDLASGAIVVVDQSKNRVRILPI